jgi:hypothetical protein
VREKLLEQMPDQEALNEKIELAFARLPPSDQVTSRQILLRLVRVAAHMTKLEKTRHKIRYNAWS